MSRAVKFIITGHVPLKSNDAVALQAAAKTVTDMQATIGAIGEIKIIDVKTSLTSVK